MSDHQSEHAITYHLTGPDASGDGHRVADGFVVRAGSKARAAAVPSTDASTLRLRDELVASGVLARDGESLAFATDHTFTSPSQAAAVILGRTANGSIEWKTADGRTLKDVIGGIDNTERDFRRRWYQAHVERFQQLLPNADLEWRSGLDECAAQALAIGDALRRTRDLAAFGSAMQQWSVNPVTGFNGFSGQMFINQIVKRSDDPERVSALLADALEIPTDAASAATRVRALAEYVETIRVGAHPSPARAPFMLSYFWGLREPATWPMMWPKSVEFLEYSTGEPLPSAPAERYVAFVRLVRELDHDNERFEQVAAWWSDHEPVFLDPVLCDRCEFGRDPDQAPLEARDANASVLVGVARYIGTALAHDVSAAAGRTLVAR